MLKFSCDICGLPVTREEAVQICLIPAAYVPNTQDKRAERGEICPNCARKLRLQLKWPAEEPLQEEPRKELTKEEAEKALQEEKKKQERERDGRCITLARKMLGITKTDLANKLYYSSTTIGEWEKGRRRPEWERLYDFLPNLKKMRKEGCAPCCEYSHFCKAEGYCFYTNKPERIEGREKNGTV